MARFVNPYVLIGGLLFIMAAAAIVWNNGYNACEAKQIKETLGITEKRNAIANNRPDDSITIDRLRDGSF
jgi:hypothetical protein